MKLKKLNVRKKSVSPSMDTLEDFNDDDICSNGARQATFCEERNLIKFFLLTLEDDKQNSPVQRNTANARERARMRVLSSAFYRLKTIIPWVPHDTKLSKLDTLRLARNYIAYLTATLDGQPVNEITNKMPHPQKMVRNSFVWIVCKQNEVKLFSTNELFLTIVEQAHPGAPRHTPK